MTFLFKKAFRASTEEEIEKYARQLDIDNDGIISEEDVRTFFNRCEYIEKKATAFAVEDEKDATDSQRPRKIIPQKALFPVEALSEEKIKELLRELGQRLYFKKMSLFEFFRVLDNNQDGLVNIDEWKQNLDQVLKYPTHIKDGLFAFIDKEKIGMIDYKTFLKTLRYATAIGEIDLQADKDKEDEWKWSQEQLLALRRWFEREQLSIEDAFRVLDHDFDGFIKNNDIDYFLRHVLQVPEKEISPSKINRIFKLMDEFKRGQIQLVDLRRILTENSHQNENFTVSGGRFQSHRNSFDWRLNATQQIGLVLSRNFRSLAESFERKSIYQKERERIGATCAEDEF